MKTAHVTIAALLALVATSAAMAQQSSPRAVNANRARLDLPIEARANGIGRVTMKGVANDGKFSVAHARIEANRDVVITIDGPAEGRILGTARNIGDRRIEVVVRQFMGSNARGSITLALSSQREIEEFQGSGKVGKGAWNVEFRRENESAGTVANKDDGNKIVIGIQERGEGSIALNEKPQMDVVAAAVLLQQDRDGEIRLDGRETVHIFGRWSEGENRTILFDASRIGDQEASGRIAVTREGEGHIAFDGELRTTSGVYRVKFRSTP